MDTEISQSPKRPWLIAIFYTQKFSLNQKIRAFITTYVFMERLLIEIAYKL